MVGWGGQAAIVGLARIAPFHTDSYQNSVPTAHVNVRVETRIGSITWFDSHVTARIHGVNPVVLGLLRV